MTPHRSLVTLCLAGGLGLLGAHAQAAPGAEAPRTRPDTPPPRTDAPPPRTDAPRARPDAAPKRSPAPPPPRLPREPPPATDASRSRQTQQTRQTRQTTLRRRRAPPPARAWHVRITARSVNLLVRGQSYDVFSDDDLLARGEVTAALELVLLERLVVAAEAGYAGGRHRESLHQDYAAEQEHHSLLLGAWLGYRLGDTVTPFVRGGFALTWLEGRVVGDGLSMGGWDRAPGGYVFGGVELSLPRRWLWRALGTTAFTLALTLEAGYVHLGDFRPGHTLDQSALVDEYRAPLGRLDLRGAALSAGITLSF